MNVVLRLLGCFEVYMWIEICGMMVEMLRNWFYFFYFFDVCLYILDFYDVYVCGFKNNGERVFGFIYFVVYGDYKFVILLDDMFELWLS